jgi:hypothetical protein
MADTGHSRSTASGRYAAEPEPTAWTGWVVFAAVMMVMVGTFQAIQGLVALFDDGFYAVGPEGLVVNVDYNVWGWVHLLVGLVIVASGFGVMAGNLAARIVGIVLAMLSAVLNLAFIAAYPLWSTIVIAIDVVVIYALTAHGREVRA